MVVYIIHKTDGFINNSITTLFNVIYMKIVKIQERMNDKVITIPAAMHDAVKGAEYLKCVADESGIHYSPLEA